MTSNLQDQTATASPSASSPSGPKVIFVGSGKGGVGKSVCSAQLALALRKHGRVGYLDADVYGPSLGLLVEDEGPRFEISGDRIIPPVVEGVSVMSLALLNEDRMMPAIWRGPAASKAVIQIAKDTCFESHDFLVVDLPPGTGDIPLSLTQHYRHTGALLITTPSPLALEDARKAARFFEKTAVPILGVVENMSYFTCPDCQTQHAIFGQDGGQALADFADAPLLAKLPIASPEAKQSLASLALWPSFQRMEQVASTLVEALDRHSPPEVQLT